MSRCCSECRLYADAAHFLMPVCVGDLPEDDAELAASLNASGITVPVLQSALVSSCPIAYAGITNINSGNRIAYAGEHFHSAWLRKCALCMQRKWVVQAVWVMGDDAESAESLYASGSTVPVHQSALAFSWHIPCAQTNNVNSGNRTAHVSMVLCRIAALDDRGLFYAMWMEKPAVVFNVWNRYGSLAIRLELLCADDAHLLTPACIGDLQNVGCASHVLYGTMLSWQLLCTPVAVLFLGFNLRRCHLVVLCVAKATVSIAAVESLMLYADDSHLLMPVCVGDSQPVGCASHDDAESAGSVNPSRNRACVVQSALVLSCRIPCAQHSNINSGNRAAYVSIAKPNRLCADNAHLLMPVCAGDIQLATLEYGVELAGSREASDSTVPVLQSALVSSCPIAFPQSINIGSGNRIAYVTTG
ncbi:hypothetical protein cyc_06751 [Cyclospora cayetanensis]|uniref:Uncharacterized protein n=1 Tax=Cyclospora cayetanensis TaxID=88456 RepID=A0A1D3D4S1_9EIME|nr:hypothetical protein cyc_06751 [Cyclospora cayetanensis]